MAYHLRVSSLSVCALQIRCYAQKRALENGTVVMVRYSRDSIMAGYMLVGLGIESCWKKDFIHLSRPVLVQTQAPYKGYRVVTRGKVAAWGMAITNHLHLTLRLKKK